MEAQDVRASNTACSPQRRMLDFPCRACYAVIEYRAESQTFPGGWRMHVCCTCLPTHLCFCVHAYHSHVHTQHVRTYAKTHCFPHRSAILRGGSSDAACSEPRAKLRPHTAGAVSQFPVQRIAVQAPGTRPVPTRADFPTPAYCSVLVHTMSCVRIRTRVRVHVHVREQIDITVSCGVHPLLGKAVGKVRFPP